MAAYTGLMSNNDPAAADRQPQMQQPAPRYASPAQPPIGPVQPPFGPARPPANTGRINVLGVIALAILVLEALLSACMPIVYQATFRSGPSIGTISAVFSVVNILLILAALGLAIGGVLQRGAQRLRWAAIGALVCAAISLAAAVLGLLINWIASMLPYAY